jgi:hypothetical protein
MRPLLDKLRRLFICSRRGHLFIIDPTQSVWFGSTYYYGPRICYRCHAEEGDKHLGCKPIKGDKR